MHECKLKIFLFNSSCFFSIFVSSQTNQLKTQAQNMRIEQIKRKENARKESPFDLPNIMKVWKTRSQRRPSNAKVCKFRGGGVSIVQEKG